VQETPFLLVVPVGLLHGAARAADRVEGAAGCVGTELVRLLVRLLVDFAGLQVRRRRVADILKNQRLGAITDDDPVAAVNLYVGHGPLTIPRSTAQNAVARFDPCQNALTAD